MSASSYFCHQCQSMCGLRNTDLVCSRCGGDFIEELDGPTHGMGLPFMRPPVNASMSSSSDFSLNDSFGDSSGSERVGQQSAHDEAPRVSRFEVRQPPAPEHPPHRHDHPAGGLMNIFNALMGRNMRNDPQQAQPPPNPGAPTIGNIFGLPGGGHVRIQRTVRPGEQINLQANEDLGGLLQTIFQASVGAQNPVNVEFRLSGNGPGGVFGDYVIGNNNMEQLLNELMNQFGDGQVVRGITEADLERLPMAKVEQKHVDNKTQCSTCFDDFVLDEDVAQLKCQHIFHAPCLKPWFSTHNTCPVCRTVIDPSEWLAEPAPEDRSIPRATAPPPSSAPAGMMDHDELD